MKYGNYVRRALRSTVSEVGSDHRKTNTSKQSDYKFMEDKTDPEKEENTGITFF